MISVVEVSQWKGREICLFGWWKDPKALTSAFYVWEIVQNWNGSGLNKVCESGAICQKTEYERGNFSSKMICKRVGVGLLFVSKDFFLLLYYLQLINMQNKTWSWLVKRVKIKIHLGLLFSSLSVTTFKTEKRDNQNEVPFCWLSILCQKPQLPSIILKYSRSICKSFYILTEHFR